jgi:hypothetical protein
MGCHGWPDNVVVHLTPLTRGLSGRSSAKAPSTAGSAADCATLHCAGATKERLQVAIGVYSQCCAAVQTHVPCAEFPEEGVAAAIAPPLRLPKSPSLLGCRMGGGGPWLARQRIHNQLTCQGMNACSCPLAAKGSATECGI